MKEIERKFADRVVEHMAAQAHKSWTGWVGWMFLKMDEVHPNGETFKQRWDRQMKTPYAELSEQEKESDRDEAREWLAQYGSILNRLVREGFEEEKRAAHVDS